RHPGLHPARQDVRPDEPQAVRAADLRLLRPVPPGARPGVGSGLARRRVRGRRSAGDRGARPQGADRRSRLGRRARPGGGAVLPDPRPRRLPRPPGRRLAVDPRPPPSLLRGLRGRPRRLPGARALGTYRRTSPPFREEPFMKWITRERVKVDRVACPWLIRKFVDSEAELLFVPRDRSGRSPSGKGPPPSTSRAWS